MACGTRHRYSSSDSSRPIAANWPSVLRNHQLIGRTVNFAWVTCSIVAISSCPVIVWPGKPKLAYASKSARRSASRTSVFA